MRVPRCLFAPALLLVLLPGIAAAQAEEAVEEGPALEFRTNVPWSRIILQGNPSVAGTSPLRVPGPLVGDLWLYAGGRGLEDQRGRVRIVLDENGSRIASYGAAPLRQALFRSLLYPGLAQWRSQQKTKGITMVSAATAGLGLSVWVNHDYQNAKDDRESLEADLAVAPDSAVAAALRDARSKEEHQRDRREVVFGVTGAIWGVSLVDALFFRPRFEVSSADETSLALSLRRKSRARALARSLFFPGLGQEYNGHSRKAFWMAMGGIAAGTYFAWRQDDLAEARAELREAETRLAELGTPEAEAALEISRGDLDDAEKERGTALWVLAGYWGVALLDTALSFEEPWGNVPVGAGEGGLGWTLDPARGAVAAQLRF